MATATTQQDSSQHSPKTLADLGDAWLAWQIALLKGNRLPLSGDVTQWIKTWGEIVGQVGLVNYNIVGTKDPMAERRIGSEYSYGRQLGRILDVLVPVVKAHEADFQSDSKKKALKDFDEMVKDIAKLKAKRYTADEVVAMVKKWKDDGDFEANIQKLREALDKLDEG